MHPPDHAVLGGFRPSLNPSLLVVVAALAVLTGCVTAGQPPRMTAGVQPIASAVVQRASFGVPETYVLGAAPVPQWTGVLARHNRALATPAEIPRTWRRLVRELRGLDLREAADRANAAINQVPYVRSELNWERRDYWETPFEFIAGSGQCQDYAVAKYLLLRAAGVPAANLRLVVVRDRQSEVAHAVVVAYADGQALVLDNQFEQVVQASTVEHYEPLYALGEEGWWFYDTRARPVGGAAGAFGRNTFARAS